MKILLTGATGFLGGRVAALLRESGHDLRALVRKSSDTRALAALGAETAEGALDSGVGVEAATRGVDAVVHLAGGGKVRTIAEMYSGNLGTTEHLLRAWDASGAAARGARFVLISSLAAHGPSPDGAPRDPDEAPRPCSHYGKSKAAAEAAVLARAGDFPVTIVRPPGVYGPGDTRMLSLFRAALRGFVPTVGQGHTASFIFVEDCARAIALSATVPTPSGRAYFVEDGHIYTQETLMRYIGDAVGTRPRVVRVPGWCLMGLGALSELWGLVTRRATPINRDKIRDVLRRHWVCESARTRAELGWTPTIALAEGTRLTAEGYRAAGWLR